MALEVRIRKKLNRFTLDMDFTAEAGVFALLGASGCGKSVTLKCIAGIERPDEGRIVLDGRVLFDSEKKINLPPQKRHVGYMFQDYALFPNMTVRQNIMTGMGKKPDQELVNSYLQRFQIAELAEEYPAKLSGGQKQRVAMARLVAQKPDVILLDEPFSALDTHLKWQLEKEMKEILNQVHKPTIFVSHSRDEVYHLCDTVCSINGGKAEVIEPVKAFFEQPKTRHAAILSGCKNVAAAERKDAHTCYVPAWGLTLHMEEEIPEDTAYVGIRAHEFREADGACAGEIQEAAGACAGEIQKASGVRAGEIQEAAGVSTREFMENAVSSEAGCICLKETEVIEDLFEWTVLFREKPDAEWLQWKVAKQEGTELKIPEKLYVNSSSVMLLRA